MGQTNFKRSQLEKQLLEQPMEVKFCKRCVVSNQRPRIIFDDEGICSACRYAESKKGTINWKQREDELVALLDKHRRTDGEFDVIVPASGGKDSGYVAHQLKYRYDMHPLTVTWSPLLYTDIGYQNYQRFLKSGFMNVFGNPNDLLNRKLARLCFEELGEPFLPFIYGQIAFPFQMALKFDIKLGFYGENGEVVYGGDAKSVNTQYFPLDALERIVFKGQKLQELLQYGVENKDYLSKDDVEQCDLSFYMPPDPQILREKGMEMHFFAHYHNWSPQENYYYAVEHTGLRANPERSEGTYSKYASLDDKLDGFHYYLAFIKFGIARTTADAAHEIRDGHLTRQEGVELVRRYDGEFPKKYFQDFLEYLGITEGHFWEVVDSFRMPHIWEKSGENWKLKHTIY